MAGRNRQRPEPEGENWIWGNHRGGGGAPLKDAYGNSVANLKNVLKGETQIDHSPSKQSLRDYDDDGYPQRPPKKSQKKANFRSPPEDYDDQYESSQSRKNKPPMKKPPRDYDDDDRPPRSKPPRNFNEDSEDDYPRNRNDNRRHSDFDERSHNSNRRGSDDRDPELYNNFIPPNPNSPKKFMSSLQAMHGVDDAERSEKQRRALEYQNMLKKQIEEKNRQKEMEKRKDEEEKRREWEEYMRTTGHNVGPNDGPSSNNMKKKPLFKPEEGDEPPYMDEPSDKNRKKPSFQLDLPPNKQGKPGQFRRNDDDEDDDSVNEHNSRFTGGGGGGGRAGPPLPKKKNAPPPRNDSRDDYDDRNDGPPPRGGGGSRKHYSDDEDVSSSKKNGKVVSAEEYDELSKLCDRLLSQQESLESEIRNQAHLIKELQKKGAANINKIVPGPPANPMLRSKSVQQSRPTNNNNNAAAGGNKLNDKLQQLNGGRSQSNAKGRPSSMYEGSKQLAINGNGKRAPATDPKKPAPGGRAAAAGKAVINDRTPANKNVNQRSPPPSQKLQNGPGAKNLPPLKKVNDDFHSNGFAKLQQKVSNQPLVVSYEEDDHVGGLNLELRGNSKYIPVSDNPNYDDDNGSYQSNRRGGGGGRDVDKLLNNARKGRFA